ncbi:hypothetical protein OEZ86_005033 [Tetradesmus obliquus]|nr:hypothetical protein OEZ86_005033 [Tetradesmus obliquus]
MKLLRRMPSLQQLHTDSLFKQLRSYTEVQQLAGPWEQQLASLTRLTSLSLSSGDLQHVGHLRRAHGVMDEAPDTSHNSSSSSSSTSEHQKTDREYAELASNERLWVYWLLDWLAAAPGLTSVSIKPSKHSGSSRNTGSGSIDSKEVDRNRMPRELPTEGWEGLSGLKELDVSYNVLEGPPQAAVLPGCISSLSALTALRLTRCWLRSLPQELTALSNMALFDASHNPLSGLRAPTVPSLASLVAARPCLQTLDLRNTSGYDNHKNSSLTLPQELAGCRNLRAANVGPRRHASRSSSSRRQSRSTA